MAIKNEDAMRDLIKLKRKANSSGLSNDYWNGVFIGTSGAYMQAGIINYDQYKTLHSDEFVEVTECALTT